MRPELEVGETANGVEQEQAAKEDGA